MGFPGLQGVPRSPGFFFSRGEEKGWGEEGGREGWWCSCLCFFAAEEGKGKGEGVVVLTQCNSNVFVQANARLHLVTRSHIHVHVTLQRLTLNLADDENRPQA